MNIHSRMSTNAIFNLYLYYTAFNLLSFKSRKCKLTTKTTSRSNSDLPHLFSIQIYKITRLQKIILQIQHAKKCCLFIFRTKNFNTTRFERFILNKRETCSQTDPVICSKCSSRCYDALFTFHHVDLWDNWILQKIVFAICSFRTNHIQMCLQANNRDFFISCISFLNY